jgi:hypothetical protein
MQSSSPGRRKRRDPAPAAAPGKRLRLPHERDESPAGSDAAKPPGQTRLIGQAGDDLQRGLQDTDCRAQPSTAGGLCPSPAGPAPRSRLARRRRSARARARA